VKKGKAGLVNQAMRIAFGTRGVFPIDIRLEDRILALANQDRRPRSLSDFQAELDRSARELAGTMAARPSDGLLTALRDAQAEGKTPTRQLLALIAALRADAAYLRGLLGQGPDARSLVRAASNLVALRLLATQRPKRARGEPHLRGSYVFSATGRTCDKETDRLRGAQIELDKAQSELTKAIRGAYTVLRGGVSPPQTRLDQNPKPSMLRIDYEILRAAINVASETDDMKAFADRARRKPRELKRAILFRMDLNEVDKKRMMAAIERMKNTKTYRSTVQNAYDDLHQARDQDASFRDKKLEPKLLVDSILSSLPGDVQDRFPVFREVSAHLDRRLTGFGERAMDEPEDTKEALQDRIDRLPQELRLFFGDRDGRAAPLPATVAALAAQMGFRRDDKRYRAVLAAIGNELQTMNDEKMPLVKITGSKAKVIAPTRELFPGMREQRMPRALRAMSPFTPLLAQREEIADTLLFDALLATGLAAEGIWGEGKAGRMKAVPLRAAAVQFALQPAMLQFLDTRAPQDVLRAVVKREGEQRASKRMLVATKTKTEPIRSVRLASGIRFRRADGVLQSIERKSRAVPRPIYNMISGAEAHPVVRAAADAKPYGELSKRERKVLFRDVTRWLERSFGLATEYEGEDAQLAHSIKMLHEHVQDVRAQEQMEHDGDEDDEENANPPTPGASPQTKRDYLNKLHAVDASDLHVTEPPSPNASPLWNFPENQQTAVPNDVENDEMTEPMGEERTGGRTSRRRTPA
jgi:hypothetical protein